MKWLATEYGKVVQKSKNSLNGCNFDFWTVLSILITQKINRKGKNKA